MPQYGHEGENAAYAYNEEGQQDDQQQHDKKVDYDHIVDYYVSIVVKYFSLYWKYFPISISKQTIVCCLFVITVRVTCK